MTKVASNPKYGWPSAKKQTKINTMWRIWAAGMRLLAQIKEEEKEKLSEIANASARLASVKRYQ